MFNYTPSKAARRLVYSASFDRVKQHLVVDA
jgi:hypothetical protein